MTLHQSAIASYIRCPESFRVAAGVQPGGDIIENPDSRLESDAATLGTVMHTVFEHDLKHSGKFATKTGMLSFAKTEMSGLLESYIEQGATYVQSSFGQDPNAIYRKLQKMVDQYWNSQERQYWLDIVRDHPEQFLFEHNFTVPFITNRSGRYTTINLAGTVDLVDSYNQRGVDWKTSGRDKIPWELSRWDIQSNVYTYALAEQGLIVPHDDGNYRFELIVWNHKNNEPEPQHVQIQRSPNNWSWLVEVVSQMVSMIESDVETWPLNDGHALCSPVWCSNWADCKGKYISGEKQVWS
jgi:hypothetical protein